MPMSAERAAQYGPGDAETWPACTGHPMDPRTEADDDLLTEDEAEDQAKEENERTPAHFATWLSEAADNPHKDRTPADVQALRQRVEDGEALTAGQWVALVVNGDDADALRAVHALRDLFRAAPQSSEFIKGRAAELLAAQEEGAHFDRMARFYLEAA